MITRERQRRIVAYVHEHGAVHIDKLAKVMRVSGSTIRADLDQLGLERLIVRTRGGAMPFGRVTADGTLAAAPVGLPRTKRARAEQAICDVGRRLYERQLVAGCDGNLSCRLTDTLLLCTPTQICKGRLTPSDLCLVDPTGRLLAGWRPCTSELRLHLDIYERDPTAKGIVHCHAPHATAFAVARVDIPTGVLPEVEVFLGTVPRAAYATPGGPELAETIHPWIGQANTVVLSNHGVVSWAGDLERACWQVEILDSYCRILLLAGQLGHVERLPEDKLRELQALRPPPA